MTTFVTAFRKFDREFLRQPMRYIPIATELKGVTNIAIGALQMSTVAFMKCCKNPYYSKTLADRHLEIGLQSLKRASIELGPTLLGVFAGYKLFWSS